MTRMFWSCTHTTLRNAELPKLIEAGFEIIPEEANVFFVPHAEALRYDDCEHPVNRLWRKRSHLPEDVETALRRVRLSERKGLISQAERDIFNKYIDVIYVATFLEAAVNVRKWFDGEVVYRYFGDFGNMSSLSDLAKDFEDRDLRNIYCLPIFSTLIDQGVTDFFDRWSVMHSLIDGHNVPPPWSGPGPDKPVVAVLSNAHVGEQLALARSLIPLARRIPITLMGKNARQLMPSDILDAFNVTETLEREEHFRRLADARFIIYPNASRHHMHFVPLEAAAAGIPLLCRDSIPLVAEYRALTGSDAPPVSGVAASHEELLDMAAELYDRPEELEAVAASQALLPLAFSASQVRKEARELYRALSRRRNLGRFSRLLPVRRSALKPNAAPLSGLSTTAFIHHTAEFVRSGGTFPIIQLVPIDAAIEFAGTDKSPPFDLAIRLKGGSTPLRMLLGDSNAKFQQDQTHRLTVRGLVEGNAAVSVHAEIWVGDRIEHVFRANSHGLSAGMAFCASLTFRCSAPATLLLKWEALGEESALLLTEIDHEIDASHEQAGWTGDVIGADDGYAKYLWQPHGLSALRAANLFGPIHVEFRPAAPPVVGIRIGATATHVLRLSDIARPLLSGTQCRLSLYSPDAAIVQAVVECWAGSDLMALARNVIRLPPGLSEVPVTLPDSGASPVIPILFLSLQSGAEPIVVQAIVDRPEPVE